MAAGSAHPPPPTGDLRLSKIIIILQEMRLKSFFGDAPPAKKILDPPLLLMSFWL